MNTNTGRLAAQLTLHQFCSQEQRGRDEVVKWLRAEADLLEKNRWPLSDPHEITLSFRDEGQVSA